MAMKATKPPVKSTAKPAAKKVVTGKPVNAYEKKRAEKRMPAYGNASAETGTNSYGNRKVSSMKKPTKK